jgi:threonine synthase
MMEISCINCGQYYPGEGMPYCCPNCGGLFDFSTPLPFIYSKIDPTMPGIWRYRHTFGISENSKPISLGEGNTPLLWASIFMRRVAFKCEYLNPSGSFKDRGSALITAWLQSRVICKAIEDSSGNAGASLAAYATREGIQLRILIPDSSSGVKRRQIESYGAELLPIPGSRTEVAQYIKLLADKSEVYASHAYLPFNLPGYATIAYEVYEELGNKMPGAVITPVGQGGLLLGLYRGFDALRIAYNIGSAIPKIIGVQVRGCAPIWELSKYGNYEAVESTGNHTLAEGVNVLSPLRAKDVLDAVNTSKGTFCVADEEGILQARNILSRHGFYVEPTSAIVWAALEQLIQELPDPVVVILTGSGFKYE